MVRIKVPAWAFNANSPYSATYTDVPNASRFYPSYTYYTANTNINKANNPAFVQNALTGAMGKGWSCYGYLNSSVVQGDPYNWVDATHVWSMAVPVSIGAPVGLFTLNTFSWAYSAQGATSGPGASANMIIYIDNVTHNLKFGTTYKGSWRPPVEIHDFGIDITPYMYNSDVQNTTAYVGHRYAFVRGLNGYDIYVDNTDNLLVHINDDLFIHGALVVQDWAQANIWYNEYGGALKNYASIGPGVYMSNSSTEFNIHNQGNVYWSDWVGWENTFDLETVNDIMHFNYKLKKSAKSYSSYSPFYNCGNLNSIVIPPIENLGSYTFDYCPNLKEITLSEGTKNISYGAIRSCSNLINLHIPKSVGNISYSAVQWTPNLADPVINIDTPRIMNMFGRGNFDYNYTFHQQPTVDANHNIVSNTPCLLSILNGVQVQTVVMDSSVPIDAVPIAKPNLGPWLLFDDPDVSSLAKSRASYTRREAIINKSDITLRYTSIEFPNLCYEETHPRVDTTGIWVSVNNIFADVQFLSNNFNGNIPGIISNGWLITNFNGVRSTNGKDITFTGIRNFSANFANTYLNTGYVNYDEDYLPKEYINGMPTLKGCFSNCNININISNCALIDLYAGFVDYKGTLTIKDCECVVFSGGAGGYVSNDATVIIENCNHILCTDNRTIERIGYGIYCPADNIPSLYNVVMNM